MMQASSSAVSHITPQPQLVSLFARHMPSQQLSPSSVIVVGAQVRAPAPEPHTHTPAWQVGELAPHAVPQAPQFAASLDTSMHAPPQQAWPVVHAAPPHPHTPAVQVSPGAHARPISPQCIVFVDVLMHCH
jgi:hypothetical protein